MYYGLKRAVQLVNRDPDLAALIITGVGDVFAPGGDLGGRSEPGESQPDQTGPDVLPFLTIRDSRRRSSPRSTASVRPGASSSP